MPNMNSVLFLSSTTPGVSIAGPALSCKVLSLSILFADILLLSSNFSLVNAFLPVLPLKIFVLTIKF